MIALVIAAAIFVPLVLAAVSWELGYRAGRAAPADVPATPGALRRAHRRQKADLALALKQRRSRR